MPISRLFHSAEDAQSAIADLRKFSYGKVGVNTHPESGGTMVVADPPFGAAARVIQILQRPRPGDTGPVNITDSAAAAYDTPEHARHQRAAPLSSALGWRLLSHNAAPLSKWFGLPLLSRNQRSGTKLLARAGVLSGPIGLPMLSKSQRSKTKLLNDAAPLSSKTGMPILSRNAAPLSRLLGLPVLSNNDAPLSRAIGASTLTTDHK